MNLLDIFNMEQFAADELALDESAIPARSGRHCLADIAH